MQIKSVGYLKQVISFSSYFRKLWIKYFIITGDILIAPNQPYLSGLGKAVIVYENLNKEG